MHFIKAVALLVVPVVPVLASPMAEPANHMARGDMDADLAARGTENCFQDGVEWKPNNGKVIQTIEEICKFNFAGQWPTDKTVKKCKGITTGNPTPNRKKMILEVGNRKGHPSSLSSEDCVKFLRPMFDECKRGGSYVNKHGWWLKLDPNRGTC